MSNVNKYRQEKEAKNEVHETPVDRKKRTDYKMVKVNNEIHKKLKLKSVESGYSMQEIAENAIMKAINQDK